MMTRDTSRDAYQDIESNGLLSERRWAVYKWLYHNGPATQSECHKKGFPNLQMDSVKPRFAELELRGVIRVVGERDCNVTGRNVLLWDVTSALPTEPRAGVWTHAADYKSWLELVRDVSDPLKGDVLRKMKFDVQITTPRKDGVRFWRVKIKEVVRK